jgi:hypothetical protein
VQVRCNSGEPPPAAITALAGLPQLAHGHRQLRELLGEEDVPTPLTELGIFVVALAGFSIFYALERLAERRAGARRDNDGTTSRGRFWVHLSVLGTYHAVNTYTLQLTYRTGVAFAILFKIAMGLHFILSERGLEEPRLRRAAGPAHLVRRP